MTARVFLKKVGAVLLVYVVHLCMATARSDEHDIRVTSPWVHPAAGEMKRTSLKDLMGDILRRKLAIGDFASVNELIANSTITIPSTTVQRRVLGFTLTLELTNLRCSGLKVGDITLQKSTISPTQVSFAIEVLQLDAVCVSNYMYQYTVLSGEGIVDAVTDNNDITASLILSQASATIPPTQSVVGSCNANVVITLLNFSGGLVASILNIMEGIVRGIFENEVNTFLCDFIVELDDFVNSFVTTISDLLDPYLNTTTVEVVDPLAAEAELEISRNVSVINFREPKGSLAVAVDSLISQGGQFLGSTNQDANAPPGKNGVDLGVNTIMRDFILDSNKALVLNASSFAALSGTLLETYILNFTILEVAIEKVKIFGLDTFTRFDPLDEIGNYTLGTSFAVETLMIEVDSILVLRSFADNSSLTEKVNIAFGINELNVSTAVLLAIDVDKLGDLQIGSLFSTSDIITCLISSLDSLNITSLIGSLRDIVAPKLSGLESPGLSRLLTTSLDGTYELYDEILPLIFPNFIEITLREVVNDALTDTITDPNCPVGSSFVGPEFIDFRDFFLSPNEASDLGGTGSSPYGNLGPLVKDTVDSQISAVDPNTGQPRINEVLINPLTQRQSGMEGTLLFLGNLFEFSSPVDIGTVVAEITVAALDARVENIDTVVVPLVLLEPLSGEPYSLNNSLGFGFPERPIRGVVRVLLGVNGNMAEINNEVDVSLDLTQARASLKGFIQIVTTRLFSLPLKDILDLNCWLATIPAPPLDTRGVRKSSVDPTLSISDLDFDIGGLQLNISCVNCSSPDVEILSDLLGAPAAKESVTQAGRVLLSYVVTLFEGEFLQVNVDRLLNDAPKRCPSNPFYEPNPAPSEFEAFTTMSRGESSGFVVALVASVLVLIFVFAAVQLVVGRIVRRRHSWWLRTLPRERVYRIYRQQYKDKEKQDLLNHRTKSMFHSECIPQVVRFLVPVVLLGNVGLFLSGHLSVGGTVKVNIELAGESIVIDRFFEFSIARSTVDLWNAGGRELAILILLFSGVWPYTKQILTLALWFSPPSWVSVKRRGSIFLWLDTLAKWSSVDIFVLIIALVAFRLTVESPSLEFLPPKFYHVDAFVVPLWGLYANLTAQLLTQISSHWIIHYHRRVLETAMATSTGASASASDLNPEDAEGIDQESDTPPNTEREGDNPEALNRHHFARPHRGEAERLTVVRGVNSLIVLAVLATSVLLVTGCIFPAFSMELLGLLGVAVEFGQQFKPAILDQSVFSVAQLLVEQGRELGGVQNYIGLSVIAIVMLLTVLVVPLLQAFALLYSWMVPMTQKFRRRLGVAIEIMLSWQYVEVFLIAIILSRLQLGQVSEFLINSYCDGLSETFATLAFYGILQPEDAQCFKVTARLEGGTYALIATAFVLAFVNTFVTRAVLQYQRDKVALTEVNDGFHEDTTRMMEHLDLDETMAKIEPTPVLFTDTFRWLLKSTVVEEIVKEIPDEASDGPRTNNTVVQKIPTEVIPDGDTNETPGELASNVTVSEEVKEQEDAINEEGDKTER